MSFVIKDCDGYPIELGDKVFFTAFRGDTSREEPMHGIVEKIRWVRTKKGKTVAQIIVYPNGDPNGARTFTNPAHLMLSASGRIARKLCEHESCRS